MNDSKSNSDMVTWKPGDSTSFAPHDSNFLAAMNDAGFHPFTGPIGLFGAISENREMHVIHRGMGRRWEVFFIEDGHDVLVTITTNLPKATEAGLEWLRGQPLKLKTDAFAEKQAETIS